MSHLLREHAPITEEAWARIDEEARERLTPALAARKLVDFAGPRGWQHSATNLGRIAALDAPFTGVTAAQRRVLPLVELRAPFTSRAASCATPIAAPRTPTSMPSTRPRTRLAVAENTAVFHGFAASGIVGIAEAAPHEAIALGTTATATRATSAKAVERLLAAGIDGPYGMALGPAATRARARERRARRLARCSTTCARSSAARWCGRRASTARWC